MRNHTSTIGASSAAGPGSSATRSLRSVGRCRSADLDADRVERRGLVGALHHRDAVRAVTGPGGALRRSPRVGMPGTSMVTVSASAPPSLSSVATKNAGTGPGRAPSWCWPASGRRCGSGRGEAVS